MIFLKGRKWWYVLLTSSKNEFVPPTQLISSNYQETRKQTECMPTSLSFTFFSFLPLSHLSCISFIFLFQFLYVNSSFLSTYLSYPFNFSCLLSLTTSDCSFSVFCLNSPLLFPSLSLSLSPITSSPLWHSSCHAFLCTLHSDEAVIVRVAG